MGAPRWKFLRARVTYILGLEQKQTNRTGFLAKQTSWQRTGFQSFPCSVMFGKYILVMLVLKGSPKPPQFQHPKRSGSKPPVGALVNILSLSNRPKCSRMVLSSQKNLGVWPKTNQRKLSWETSELRTVGKGNQTNATSIRSEIQEMWCKVESEAKEMSCQLEVNTKRCHVT